MIWINISPHIAKSARFTMGVRIENKLLDLLECARTSYYAPREEKLAQINKCILLLDSVKFLISIAWEAKYISHRHFEEIAKKLDEIGRMFGGWKNSLNNPYKKNYSHTPHL